MIFFPNWTLCGNCFAPLLGSWFSFALQEYDDYDDYEDEGQEGGQEYEEEGEEEECEEEEEPRKPTKEELEYLELRQKLKESIRKQMKKENSASLADSSARKKLPYDKWVFEPSCFKHIHSQYVSTTLKMSVFQESQVSIIWKITIYID